MQWLTGSVPGELVFTMLMAMLPVIELRGGIPFGTALGLSPWAAMAACIAGNLLPVPFLIVYSRRVLRWLRRRFPALGRTVDALERKAHLKGRKVTKYKYFGLFLFVAVPLPGTGAWTGSLAAAFLDMPLRRALPSIALGVGTAGVIVTMLTHGVRMVF